MNLRNLAQLGVALLLLPLAVLARENGGRGGGAGTIRGDILETFYRAGVQVGAPITSPDVPSSPAAVDQASIVPLGLEELEGYIQGLSYLTPVTKSRLLLAIRPSLTRKYIRVSNLAPELRKDIVQNLLREFGRITGLDPRKLKLYAFTNTTVALAHTNEPGRVTYLLDGFDKLQSRTEQMTALFHESFWVLNPQASYQQVVQAEIDFQAALEAPHDTKLALKFIAHLRDTQSYDLTTRERNNKYNHYESLHLWAKLDLESEALRGFLGPRNEIRASQLFSEDNIRCFHDTNTSDSDCYMRYMGHLDSLRRSYPRSFFLAAVGDHAARLRNYQNYNSNNVFIDVLSYLTSNPLRGQRFELLAENFTLACPHGLEMRRLGGTRYYCNISSSRSSIEPMYVPRLDTAFVLQWDINEPVLKKISSRND